MGRVFDTYRPEHSRSWRIGSLESVVSKSKVNSVKSEDIQVEVAALIDWQEAKFWHCVWTAAAVLQRADTSAVEVM